MKTFKNQACQGEHTFTRYEGPIPTGFEKVKPEAGDQHIIGHSESGHHHMMAARNADFYRHPDNILRAFIVVKKETILEHKKEGPDQHEALLFPEGTFEVNYAREGWSEREARRALD